MSMQQQQNAQTRTHVRARTHARTLAHTHTHTHKNRIRSLISAMQRSLDSSRTARLFATDWTCRTCLLSLSLSLFSLSLFKRVLQCYTIFTNVSFIQTGNLVQPHVQGHSLFSVMGQKTCSSRRQNETN